MKTTFLSVLALAAVSFVVVADVGSIVQRELQERRFTSGSQQISELTQLRGECRRAFPLNARQQQWCVEEGLK